MADTTDEWGLPSWPAAERNKQPILEQLSSLLVGREGLFVELASATGQHIQLFSEHLPGFIFQPSDFDDEHLETLARRVKVLGRARLLPPLRIDAAVVPWPVAPIDVLYNANMIHIAPWRVTEGLFRGAAHHLKPGGMLVTYGPYSFSGKHTSESNEKFDQSLRSRDASWGVRDVEDLSACATKNGIALVRTIPMPANNFILVWERAPVAAKTPGEEDVAHD